MELLPGQESVCKSQEWLGDCKKQYFLDTSEQDAHKNSQWLRQHAQDPQKLKPE